jgi:hypothetical protein
MSGEEPFGRHEKHKDPQKPNDSRVIPASGMAI